MSGIVGILNLDGRPVEPALLQRLTDFLAFRGPDVQGTWHHRNIGLGFTFLDVSTGTERDSALARDGEICVVADARIDDRRDLESKLHARGCDGLARAGNAEIILRAYQLWGEQCLDHLLGDFAFAIWDGPRRRLFCARDQLGVKPFFYARIGPLLVFSNTLDCVRQHAAISNRLNDSSIADFLVFDLLQDPAATAFADIKRLPPAHLLVAEPETERVSIRRYWEPSAAAPVHYRRPSDYVEHFCELLDTAVADRLPAENVCVFMSGGLDSPTVAASAQRISQRDAGKTRIWAFTQVFDRLLPHDERHYAGMVANALKIPIEYHADDDIRLFQYAQKPEYRSPEPIQLAWPNITIDHLRRASTEGRVVLTGFGADPIFSSRISVHFRELLQQRRWGRALADAAIYLSAEGRISRLYLRTRWRLLFASKQAQPDLFPAWLNEDLATRLNLRERWETVARTMPPAGARRPEAYEVTFGRFWTDMFNFHDPHVTGVPVEVRYPFFDLRLMNFILGLPRLPWCCDKQLLREAGRGVLPETVRLRRKSPLQASPLFELCKRPENAWVDDFEASPALERYVVRSRIPSVLGGQDALAGWMNLRALSLDFWLRSLDSPGQGHEREAGEGLGTAALAQER